MQEHEIEILLIEEYLKPLGYNYVCGYFIAPDGETPERGSYSDILLKGRLLTALQRINPDMPTETNLLFVSVQHFSFEKLESFGNFRKSPICFSHIVVHFYGSGAFFPFFRFYAKIM